MAIIILLIVCIAMMMHTRIQFLEASKQLDELGIRVDIAQQEIVERTVFEIIEDPELLFRFLENAPAWEEIDAVPYSRCYRHLIGTTTADFIFCQAI